MKLTLFRILTLAICLCGGSAAFGQETKPDPQPTPEVNRPNQQIRMLRELGLTQEQVQQIRRINAERQPLMRDAQEKLREANRQLDAAIYSESVSEEDVKLKMKDVQLAQAEVTKVKTLTEYLIRKVLTPEQLEKFRELRERLMNRQNQNSQPGKTPADRIRDRRTQRPIE